MFDYLKNKYNSIPLQAKASLWFLICGILQNGLNVITLPIFTRLLTTEQYGLSSTYFAWNDLIIVLCTLRLSYGVFDKGMIKYENSRDAFSSCTLGLATTISLSMLCVFLILHKYVESWLGLSFVLCFSLFASQVVAPSLLFWTSRNKFEFKYKEFVIVTLLTSIVCVTFNLLSVLLLPFDRGITKILSYQIVWFFVYLFFYIYLFRKGKKFYDREIWKYLLKFNLPLIPYFLSTIVLDKADRIMIDNYCGKTDVALYSVSYNLGHLMILLTSSLDATITPWLYRRLKEENFERCKGIIISILVMFMGVATFFMLLAPEVIRILAAPEYSSAVYIIPSVVCSFFCVMVYGIVSKIEFYFEKTKIIAFVTVGAALLDIGLNALLIPRYGYIAAGYTTLASYMFMALMHMIVAYEIARSHGIHKKIIPWGYVMSLIGGMVIISIGVNFIYQITEIRLAMVLVLLSTMFIFKKKIVMVIKTIK